MLARDEQDVNAPVEAKVIEEHFTREGVLLNVHVGGEVIQTTPEHPFYVRDKGWTPAGELAIGDELSTHTGEWIAIDDLFDTGESSIVYNFRVADHHTYFVGSADWGFSVWVHNSYMGDLGETAAKGWLKRHGYTDVVQIQNRSGHGIDLIARHRDGTLTFFEIKTSASRVAPRLSQAQENAVNFIQSRLGRAAGGGPGGTPWWRGAPSAVSTQAADFLAEISSGATFRRYVMEITNATDPTTATHLAIRPWR